MTEEESRRQKAMYDYFFVAPTQNAPTRAEQLDKILFGWKFAAVGMRGLLWIAGAAIATKGAFDVFNSDWFSK